MKTLYVRVINFIMLSILLPFVCGCQGGGGALSFLGGGGSSGGNSFVGGGGGGGEAIATVHNPEPGTMLLLGSGLVAMAFYNRKGKKK